MPDVPDPPPNLTAPPTVRLRIALRALTRTLSAAAAAPRWQAALRRTPPARAAVAPPTAATATPAKLTVRGGARAVTVTAAVGLAALAVVVTGSYLTAQIETWQHRTVTAATSHLATSHPTVVTLPELPGSDPTVTVELDGPHPWPLTTAWLTADGQVWALSTAGRCAVATAGQADARPTDCTSFEHAADR